MPMPSYIHVRVAGLLHAILGVAIVAALVFFPFFRFVLLIVLPVAVASTIVGVRLMLLKSKLRVALAVISGAILFFLLPNLPHDILVCCRDAAHFLQTLLIDGGLFSANAYVIWALYFSKDAAYFRARA